MCVSIPHSYDFTENICEWCVPGDDQDHIWCDEYTEEACACRNAEHKLTTPEQMFEKMLAAMNLDKDKVVHKEEVNV